MCLGDGRYVRGFVVSNLCAWVSVREDAYGAGEWSIRDAGIPNSIRVIYMVQERLLYEQSVGRCKHVRAIYRYRDGHD